MITVRPYLDADKLELIKLIDHPEYKSVVWDWQFSNATSDNRCLVATHEASIVGFNGVMPVDVWFDKEAYTGAWSCDFYVEKQMRSKGIGKAIKDELLKMPARFIMSLGISDSAYKLLLAKGWSSVPNVRVYRKRLTISSIREIPHALMQFFNLIKGKRYSLLADTLSIQAKLPPAEQLDRLWNNCKNSYSACVSRNSAYLNWRYAEHPLANYQYCIARYSGEVTGILIYKIEDNILRVIDYIGPATASALKFGLLTYVIDTHSDLRAISFTTSDKEWHKVLLDMGFYCSRQTERFVVNDKLNQSKDVEWYITGGDSDGEIIQSSVYSMINSKAHEGSMT